MPFTNFPKFLPLTLADRKNYETLIKDYPPISDISFQWLMGWWGLDHAPNIALLNGNIIIDYRLSGEDKNSGLSIIGSHNIDESICTLFDYLTARGEKPRLVHVPEFVVNNMNYPELFSFDSERAFDEYVLAIAKYFPLENSSFLQQRRVERFIKNAQDKRVQVGSLDLASPANQKLLLECAARWPKKGLNDTLPREPRAIASAIANANKLGLENVCLNIDGELHGFLLFEAPHDQKYMTLEFARISYAMPYLLNFMVYVFAEWFIEQNVVCANLGMDYGRPSLRITKLALKPMNFFRKYTLEPAEKAQVISFPLTIFGR